MSGTLPAREYSEQELKDAISLIEWLSTQPWSTGSVGMYGHSWSGFNAIQVAIRHPPALKTIVAQVSTEDLYHEGERFPDGIFHFDSWNAYADLLVTTPEGGKPLAADALAKRFDQPPWTLTYSHHPHDDAFWRPEIRVDKQPQELTIPIMMLGGWFDGYRNAIYRALGSLHVPMKAIVGPWNHRLDNPGPLADLDGQTLRWWDFWLKGKDTGVMRDPQLTAYMRRPYVPAPFPGAIPGEWRAVQSWPPTDLKEQRLYLTGDGRLSADPSQPATQLLRYVPSAGIAVGTWWGDPMPDQRSADAYSLVYESPALTDELNVLGQPRATLLGSSSASQANWFVRLSDVAPDGTVTLVTGGALNGTQRESGAHPSRLTPDTTYSFQVPMLFTSWIFERGHRIRVSVSNAQWPMYWPTPFTMTTTVQLGGVSGSQLVLPVLPPVAQSASLQAAQAIGSRNVAASALSEVAVYPTGWTGPVHFEHDSLTGITRVTNGGKDLFVEWTVSDKDPAHASVVGTRTVTKAFGGHEIQWSGKTEVTSDPDSFHIRHSRELRRDGKIIRKKQWDESIPRDLQ